MSDEAETTATITKVSEVPGFSRHPQRDRTAKPFCYRAPVDMKRSRAFVPMVRSESMIAMVQVLKEGGGEQELHSHGALDGFWFVLKGRAKFYDKDDQVIGDLGEHDGIFIPHDFLYWFEAVGNVPLELLQVEAIDRTLKNTYYAPKPLPQGEADVYTPDGVVIGHGLKME